MTTTGHTGPFPSSCACSASLYHSNLSQPLTKTPYARLGHVPGIIMDPTTIMFSFTLQPSRMDLDGLHLLPIFPLVR